MGNLPSYAFFSGVECSTDWCNTCGCIKPNQDCEGKSVECDISIRITFVSESTGKTLNFQHHLKLHQWVVSDLSTGPDADLATTVSVVR
ncbi:hypothetical protein BS47DRAFT_1437627 [Hydnum rufescens UP504]|uniref:Uncharacterized protein n=1 Tax=Hydnum rufescens UP504 TaxID=1448309 RepID=A0A9P6AFJ6_9AGAM|nr:hypothetical protein BS47DRAFT_1437627 [Hydnum rufescens UP504]